MNIHRVRKRKAVSEIIGTLMILAITVAGAVLVANFVRDGFFDVSQNPSGSDARADSIQLTGYDTRDSNTLINVASLDNVFNDDGTEFIALQLRNMNTNSVFLSNIQVNNVLHAWDDGTAGWSFDATLSGGAGTTYPKAGFFSIIPSPDRPNPDKQFVSQEVQGNEEVRVIIKLSETLSDIKMWDSMLIVVNFGGSQPAQFIVSSGDAKW